MSVQFINKNILILGSSGLIGSRLFKYLENQKINVKGISRSKSSTTTNVFDFTSKKCPSIQKLFDEADLIINFISIAHKNDDSNSLIQINKKTLKNTFEYDFNPSKYIYASSQDAIQLTESSTYDLKLMSNLPFWLKYGFSKGICEKICLEKSKNYAFTPFLEPNTKDYIKRSFQIKPFDIKLIFKPNVFFEYTNSQLLFNNIMNIDVAKQLNFIEIKSNYISQESISRSIEGPNLYIPRAMLAFLKLVLRVLVKKEYRKHFDDYISRKFLYQKAK